MSGRSVEKAGLFRRVSGYVGPVAAVVVTVVALWLFHQMTAGLRLEDIKAAIGAMQWSAILLALLATCASYSALATYDIVACHIVAPGKVPWRNAALSGMSGYAFSNFLGFHLFTGGAVRFRTYSRSGLDAGEIGQVVLLSWMGLWLAFTALVGLALLLDPDGVPLLSLLHDAADRAVGLAVLAVLIGLFVFAGPQGRELRLFAWRVPLPPRRMLLLQLLVGVLDLLASAAVLYVLLPPDVQPGAALFLTIYMSAVILGSISHVPGGIGVFEATLIAGLGLQGRADILASLLAYRLIYYFLPFLIALVVLAAAEAGIVRGKIAARFVGPTRAIKALVPMVAATVVFISGFVLLLSGATPGVPDRLETLEDWLPLSMVESSHFLGSLVGLALLVVAHGLQRRLFSAWVVAVAMLFAGALLSLVKGLDWEEALTLALAAMFLLLSREAFYRRTPQRITRLSWEWLGLVALTLVATTWLGFFSYSHVEYSNELFWQFAWNGEAPRFLRATVGLVVASVALGVAVAIHRPPAKSKRRAETEPEAIAAVIANTPDTQNNVAFLGDKEFLWSPDGSAFLMYGRAGRSLVSMGDPVGDPEQVEDLVWQFRDMADREAARAVFYAVRPDNLPLYVDMGYALLKLGEVARVDLSTFSLEGPKNQEHRYVDRRATKEGLVFDVIPREDVPGAMNELRSVSDAWLQEKGGSEKGFSLGRFDPAYLAHFDCAVMRDVNNGNRIVAFANIWRSGDMNEMSIDLMRYLPEVSKVLMDALFVRLLLYAKEEGYRWFNLGAAPLSGLADHALASRWNRMATFVFRHGDDFYHFEGLRAFKEKFSPVWTPQYLACPGGLNIPQVLLDVNALISGGIGRLIGSSSRRPKRKRVRAAQMA
ncbi:bifunctional lysylphosphatidylglycerol flippase/synthetase MprF [Mesorhizobium sp. KR1-2]|uniref:bifunctional lysylphosphatidylglycerol flippase/synthetase MprF n=1 Tax=Mesorhizobium sp. KR1-2 TaxID=3156609 RepID=UPI0032B4A012